MTIPQAERWRTSMLGAPAPRPLPPAVLGGPSVVMRARQSNASLGLDQRLCVVRSGRLVARLEPEPGLHLAEVLLPGDLIAEGAFGGAAPRTLTALTAASLVVVDGRAASNLLVTGGATTRWLLEGMTHRVKRAENRQTNLMTTDLRARLARFLLDWCQATTDVHLPGPFRGGFTQSVLAELVGSTRHTVNRTLQDFERRGVVVLEDGGITVEDFAVMRRCARSAAPYLLGAGAHPLPKGAGIEHRTSA